MKKYTENAKDYFDRHPQNDECHITSDGRVFHTLGAAQGFAGTLDDQTIESFKRSVLEKESKTDDAGDKDAKLKELSELELVKENYNQIKGLVKFFDLKPADQKAETLISALTDYKNSLNS